MEDMIQLPEHIAGPYMLIFQRYEHGVISSLPSMQSRVSSPAESVGHILASHPGQAQQTWVRGSHCDKGRVKGNPGVGVWASFSVKTCLEKHRTEILSCQHGFTVGFPLNFTSSVPTHVDLNSSSPLTHTSACLQWGSQMRCLPESGLKLVTCLEIEWNSGGYVEWAYLGGKNCFSSTDVQVELVHITAYLKINVLKNWEIVIKV